MTSKTLLELVATVKEHVKKLESYLTAVEAPLPSLEKDGPLAYPVLPFDVNTSRLLALEASHDLHCLLQGSTEHLLNHIGDYHNPLSLQFIHKYQIAQLIPPNGERTFLEISTATGQSLIDVQRFLRHAMTNHIFTEPREGIVAHTGPSRVLVDNPLAAAWVGGTVDMIWPSLPRVLEASEKWPGSEEPNHTGFALYNNTNLLPFEFIEKDPRLARQFMSAMKSFQSSPGFEASQLVDNFDFKSLGNGVVVDVGGSHGLVSIEIARSNPKLHCIVQDLGFTIAEAQNDLPEDLKGRVEFMAHDYFLEQPVNNADLYYFRWIFHDLSDKYCIKILKALIPALKPGAKILINDICLPDFGCASIYVQKRLRASDMTMKAFSNSKERQASDWRGLFAAADKRFSLKVIEKPLTSNLSIITAVWQE